MRIFAGRINYEQKDDHLVHCWCVGIGSGPLFRFSEGSLYRSHQLSGIHQLPLGIAGPCYGDDFILSAGGPMADHFDIFSQNNCLACLPPHDDRIHDQLHTAGASG